LIYINQRGLESKAPRIIERKSVHEAMHTGVLAVDSIVPIGRGQRELIIGDRGIGKTAICLDTILSQKSKFLNKVVEELLYCIIVSTGQKQASVLLSQLYLQHVLHYCLFVVATCAMPATYQFLAPFTGCTIGEFFRDQGLHALVVYDDLSKQAVAFRQISLLLRRPPGREAYPGDIFYLHSRLLERAAKLNDLYGNGSLTALPIIEIQAGDVAAYISTNVISITDGQIFLETAAFNRGQRPAINAGLSVSRVGASAQHPLIKQIANKLRLLIAQYKETELFAKYSKGVITPAIAYILNQGRLLINAIIQEMFKTLTLLAELVILYGIFHIYFDDLVTDTRRLVFQQFITNVAFYVQTYFCNLASLHGIIITPKLYNFSIFELEANRFLLTLQLFFYNVDSLYNFK